MPLDTTSRMLTPFLDHLTDDELDALPYGIVRLHPDGTVASYNRAEAANLGIDRPPLGQHFFRDVALCADVPEFHGRFLVGVAEEKLDVTFTFTFSCTLLPRRVMVRMYYSVRTKSVWLFLANPDGSPFERVPLASKGESVRRPQVSGIGLHGLRLV